MSISLKIFENDLKATSVELPLYKGGISCGLPSPSFESVDAKLDINKKLIKNPMTTFYATVNGQSMIDDGIDDGDLLVIDRSLAPENNKIAVCFLDGEFTCKRMKFDKKDLWLMPANDNFPPIKVLEENRFVIWGIVTHVIKSF